MKTKTLFILALSNFAICTALFGQIQKQSTLVKKESVKITNADQSVEKEVMSLEEIKKQLLQDWKFRYITLVTPKDGYLMHIADQEVHLVKVLIANYSFNVDGSITLDPTYIEKQGVQSAKWEVMDTENIVITYYWTAKKQEKEGLTNDYEKLEYKIDVISKDQLILNWNDMFIVKLIVPPKK